MRRFSPRFRLGVEALERRETPSAITVQTGQLVRILNDHVFGINLNSYDGVLTATPDDGASATPDPKSVNLLTAAGTRMTRLSNGFGSDSWHFAQKDSLGFHSGAGVLANLTTAAVADAMVCVNYGTGTPEEAAAYLAYLNGSDANNSAIGTDANGKNWGTVATWAGLRGQAPLGVDDGLNHLRANHPAAYGFRYFEVGNEAYFGGWNGGNPKTPAGYAAFTVAFANLNQTRAIDPAVKIGIGVGNPGEWDNAWNGPVLDTCKTAGFTPAFLSDHYYAFDGVGENNQVNESLTDAQLLNNTVSDPNSVLPIHGNSPRNWAGRATGYRTLLTNRLGPAGAGVELLVGEFNSDSGASSKQTTALTNGLFVADALGSLIQTEYTGAMFWNFRNEYTPNPVNPNPVGVSGLRPGADSGMVGSRNGGTVPQTGPYVKYPTYFGLQLASMLGRTGDKVVPVASDTLTVAAYAVKRVDGHVALLLINKSPNADDTAMITLPGFNPAAAANLFRYGKTEDTAQQNSADGAATLTHTTPNLAVNGTQFSLVLPAYSMSLLELTPVNVVPPTSKLFVAPVTISDPNFAQTTVVAVGKFNGDDFPDLAVTNYGSGSPNYVSILYGSANGTFSAVTKAAVDVGGPRLPEGGAAGDFDKDGDDDLFVVLNEGSANNVVILRNDGGKFVIAQTLTAGTNATHISAADLTGDGFVDLAVSNFAGGVSIFTNTAGKFAAAGAPVDTGGTGCNQVVAADFDGDGDRDLAVANQNDGTVGILLNNGSAGFTLARTLKAAQLGTTFLAAEDVNFDGRPDLVASNTYHQPSGTPGNTISLFLNAGGGAFDTGITKEIGQSPTGVVLRDFNGDGMVDIAVGNEGIGQVFVLINNGGVFLDPVPFLAIAGVNGLAAGDFNADGRPDLVVTQYVTGNKLAVLANGLIGTGTTMTVTGVNEAARTVTLKASVVAASGPGVTTGYVSFFDGETYLETVSVGADGTATFTTTPLATGPHQLRVSYSDALDMHWYGSQSAVTTVTITPAAGNTAPTISAIGNMTSTADQPIAAIPFTVSDAETDPAALLLTFAASNPALVPNANITLGGSGASRTVMVIPAAGKTGTATITLTVQDAGGLSASESFTVTINPVQAGNTAPTIGDIPDRVVSVGGSTGGIPFTIGDAETAAESLALTFTMSDTELIPTAGIVFGGSGASRTVTVNPAAGKTGTATIALTVHDAAGATATNMFTVTVLQPGSPPKGPGLSREFAIGDGAGSVVRFFNPNGTERFAVDAFPGFAGGIRTAAADFTGDGVADEVVGTGPGGPTLVRVLDGVTGAEVFRVEPFEAAFTGGVYVAAGDINGDGVPELVITPDEGGGPRARVFNGKGFGVMADFFGIADPNFRGGARAGIGDINGDGFGDLVVAAGFGGGPRTSTYDGSKLTVTGGPTLFGDFFAFEDTLRNGTFVSVGDIDGDGKAEMIIGAGPGGGPRVSAFSAVDLLTNKQTRIADFFAGDTNSRGGVRVAVKNLDGDNRADVVVGAGVGSGNRVTAYSGKNLIVGNSPELYNFDAFPGLNGGIFVG